MHIRSRRARPLASALVAASLAIVLGTTPAAGDNPPLGETPVLFTGQLFSGPVFPPNDWSTPQGTWSQTCPAPVSVPGCSAVAAIPNAGNPGAQLVFDPSSGIPTNLHNPTLSFYSDFTPDPGSAGDTAGVYQSDNGTLDPEHTHPVDTAIAGRAHASQVLVTIPLTSTRFPLLFKWTTFGSSSPTPSGTWAISDVTISGTIADTAYTLTADPIDNLAYNVTSGIPVVVTLSGSSVPIGDSLSFAITKLPALGTLGPITTVDATHAHVTYSSAAGVCPNPLANPTQLCTDSFQYKATDLGSNNSAPVNAALDVHPGGAGLQKVTVDSPSALPYELLFKQAGDISPTQGASLNDVTVGPLGFPDRVEVDLHVTAGGIYMPALAGADVTLLNSTAPGTADVQFYGSINHVRNAMAGMAFFPGSGTPDVTFSVTTFDRGSFGQFTHNKPGGTGSVLITAGTPPPPRPVITLPAGPLPVISGPGQPLLGFPAGAATGISLVDGGAGAATLDTVHLTLGGGGALALPSGETGITQVPNFGGLDLTGTVADLNAAFLDLAYDPSNVAMNVPTATLTAVVTDPVAGTNSAQKTVNIAVGHAPIAIGQDQFTTRTDQPTTAYLCGVGPEPDGSTIGFSVTGGPSHGTFVATAFDPGISNCGHFVGTVSTSYAYTPASGYSGPDSLTYKVHDSLTGLDSPTTTIHFTVTAHAKPTAENVTAFTQQDEPVDIELCGTDSDAPPRSTVLEIISNPASGTLTDAADQSPRFSCPVTSNVQHVYTYTPNAGAFASDGTDSFSYAIDNGTQSDVATASITVTTHTPHAPSQTVSVDENSRVGIKLCSTAPDGGPLTINITSGPTHGTLDFNGSPNSPPPCAAGSVDAGFRSYIPAQTFRGTDSFTYTVSSHGYTSAPATVSITVDEIEIPPVAHDQQLTDVVPTPLGITLSATSENGLPLTYHVVTPPTQGTLGGTGASLTYTPSAHPAQAQDSFTFAANDGVADSAPATVTILLAKPQLNTHVCYPGLPSGLGVNVCDHDLDQIPDGPGGDPVLLAHTAGNRVSGLELQVAITNASSISDSVTLKAPAGVAPWSLSYLVLGADVTSQITGAGLVVSVAAFADATIQVVVGAPPGFPAPATTRFAITATSGNDPAVTGSQTVVIQDGTSTPTLKLAQANGSGVVTYPGTLTVPPMATGKASRTIQIQLGLTGTGHNVLRLSGGTDSPVEARYFLGTTDITAGVLAGTQTIDCFGGAGCPPITATIKPLSDGHFGIAVSAQSVIDGGPVVFASFQGTVGTPRPDLWDNAFPLVGDRVYEPTPVTEVVSQPVQASHAALRTLIVHDDGTVESPLTLTVSSDTAATDPSSHITVTGFPAGTVDHHDGTYTLPAPGFGNAFVLAVTDNAGPAGAKTSSVTVTLSADLDPSKVDSFRYSFPTYAYSPQVSAAPTDPVILVGAPVTQDFAISEHNTGNAPVSDSIRIKAPASDGDFNLAYKLRTGTGTATDVTAAVTGGDGMITALAVNGDGSTQKTLTATATATDGAHAAATKDVAISVTSTSSLPVAVSAGTSWKLVNWGLPPTVSISAPADQQTLQVGDIAPVAYACVSGATHTCSLSVTPPSGSAVTPLANGSNVPTTAGGRYTLTAMTKDQFDRSATATSGYIVVVPPKAVITSPADGAHGPAGGSLTAAYECTSVASTIASCSATLTRPDGSSGAIASGATFAISAPGKYQLTLTATDARGLTDTTSSTYTVDGAVADCTRKVDIGVVEVTTEGCFATTPGTGEPAAQTRYATTSPTKLNGIPLPAPPSGLFFTVQQQADGRVHIGLKSATVTILGYPVFNSQEISWALPSIPSSAPNGAQLVQRFGGAGAFKGMKINGGIDLFFGKDSTTGVYYASFVLHIGLPEIFKASTAKDAGGVTADASVKFDKDGFHDNGLQLKATNVAVGSLVVKSVCFAFVPGGSSGDIPPCERPDNGEFFPQCGSRPDVDRWSGAADIALPQSGQAPSEGGGPGVALYGDLNDNKLAALGGSISNLGQSVPVGTNVYLEKVAIGLCVDPPPFEIKGNVGVSVMPTAKSTFNPTGDTVHVDGIFDYRDAVGSQPWKLSLSGSAQVLGKQIGSAYLTIQQTGLITFGASLGLTFGNNLVSVNGFVDGWLDTPKPTPTDSGHVTFNVSGGVRACISSICGSITAVASNNGVAGCLSLGSISVPIVEKDSDWAWYAAWRVHWTLQRIDLETGFGTHWDAGSPSLFAGSCDMGSYSLPRPATRSLRAGGALDHGLGFNVAAGTPALAVRILGTGGAPSFVMHGPGGDTIASPLAPDQSAQSPGHWVVIDNPGDSSASVLLINPPAGDYTITPGSGLVTPTSILTSEYAPPPAIAATVVKRSDGRATIGMGYAIPTGAKLSLVELGRRTQKTLVADVQGKTCPGPNRPGGQKLLCTRVRFTPTAGPGGKRRIFAIVTNADGLPLERRQIASFKAAPQHKPSRPTKLRMRRDSKGVLVSWNASRPVRYQQVIVKLGFGARFGITAKHCSAIRLRDIPPAESVSVTVSGVRGTDSFAGPSATQHLAAGKPRTPGASGTAPHACIVHGPSAAG